MAVTEQTPRNVSIAVAGATVFPYDFKILDKGDLLVQVDGVTKTVDVDFTVSGVGNDAGGNITLSAGLPAGAVVMRKRSMKIQRLNDFQSLGDLRSPTLNNDQDSPVMMMQQLADGVAQSMKLPDHVVGVSSTLPAPAALNPLIWSADGTRLENGNPLGTGDMLLRGDLASTTAGKGSELIQFRLPGSGTVARKSSEKMSDIVSLKDFGAKGDNATNDTTAVLAAIAYMANTGYGVHLPPGIYLCDPFVINTQFYDLQAMLSGDDRERCILRRRTAGTGPFIQLGDPLSTVYQSGVNFSGLQIDGGTTTNGPAIAMYDVVRTSFHQCRFKGGSDAVKMYGGISVSFNDCVADLALRGLDITKFTSLAGGGYPNLIKWIGGEIVDNTQWGVRFDYGNLLTLRDCDIEGNGTTLGASEGGVYVGPNVGEAVFASDTNSPGVVMSGCWIEANKGRAGVMLESGRNSLESCWWFSQATNITNDVYVTGGRYIATNCKFSFAKAANLLEGAGVLAGNLIQNTLGSGLTVDSVKTMLLNGSSYPFVQYNGGRAIVASGISAPHVQVGSDASGDNPTIAFASAFKAGTTPKVTLTVVNNGATTLDAPEVYNITNAGFTLRKKQYNGTAITTANYQVDWTAIGEAPGT